MNQPCTEQNFIPKKKKKTTPTQREFTVQTRRNFIKRKKKKVGCWMKKGNFVQHASSPFFLPFSLYFVKTEF